jgi:hypothetical protein
MACVGAVVALLLSGCQTGGRPSEGRAPAAVAPGRAEFRSYNFSKDVKGAFVVVAQVRVRSADGARTRDFYVKAGDPIGSSEPDGDYRTGLRVVKIDKGDRPIKTRIDGQDATVVMNTYYLLARDASGDDQVLWLAATRPEPAVPGPGK